MTTTDEGAQGTPTLDNLVDTVVGLMPDPAVVVDGDGRIVAANALADRQFGYPAGGLKGVAVDSLVPERLRSKHVRHRDSYVAKPAPRPMGAGISLWAARRDGSEFPVDISLAPLGVPERPLTMAAIRDMTLQRAEWESEARLASIVASSEDAMVSMDLQGMLTSWNPGAERLLGYDAAAMIGRSFWRLVPQELRSDLEERLGRVRAGMRSAPHDTKRMHLDGRLIDVAESMSVIPDVSGRPMGFAAVLRDITDRKLAELELRHLLSESQRRERWLSAMSEVRLAMFSSSEHQQWLDLVTKRVSELLDADGVMVTLPAEDDRDLLRVAGTRGMGLLLDVGDAIPVEMSLAGKSFRTGNLIVSTNFRSDSPAPSEILDEIPIGPIILAPMTSSSGPMGVLIASRVRERPPFDAEDVRLIESFAQQAGLGMELSHAQAERSQFALISDRERIARDLHDHVIQRLFAVGMMLQSAAQSIAEERAQARIESSVEELDATIRDVRSTIFSLEIQATEHVATSLRSRLLDVASLAAPALGFQPRLQFDGPIDTKVPEEFAHDILAVVRETLSNAARHADARAVEIHVGVGDDVVIEVNDDGRGAEDRVRSSGLANLKTRAEQRGGSMSVGMGRKDRGTRIEWRVPLPG